MDALDFLFKRYILEDNKQHICIPFKSKKFSSHFMTETNNKYDSYELKDEILMVLRLANIKTLDREAGCILFTRSKIFTRVYMTMNLYVQNQFELTDINKLIFVPKSGGNVFYTKEKYKGKIMFDQKIIGYFDIKESYIVDILNNLKLDIPLAISQVKSEKNKQQKKFKQDVSNVLLSLDKDGNGEVDAVEGNDFNTLLKKHQKTILEIDRNYVKKFVKISTYLKDKKANIQDIFNSISDTPNESILNEYVGILKNEVNTYHMILANGLTMLVALIEDDVITYEEIYESMDRINIFDSQWEKDVSQKLSDIGDGLNSLMYEIEASNRRIVNELSNLTYATEEGFRGLNSSITSELQSIDSSIKFNNLLTGIQTYQMYKVNKNTKSLRG